MGRPSKISDFLSLKIGYNWRIDVLPAGDCIELLSSGLLVPRVKSIIQAGHNKLLTVGLDWVRDRINNGAQDSMGFMARGSDGTAELAADTGLNTETERDAISSTVASSAQIIYQYLEVQTANNGQAFKEAGLVNLSSGGTFLNRWTYTVINKTSLKQILYSVTLVLSEG